MTQYTNTVQQVQDKMRALIGDRAEQLAELSEKISAARKQEAEAAEAMQQAQAETNLKAYAAAKAAKLEAGTAVEMYSGRAAQLQGKGLVTEEESDSVIDSLLDYEAKISAEFEAAISGPLDQLRQLQADYAADIDEAERTIRTWTQQIHANHRSSGTIYADGSNRSPQAVPVHRVAYTGCAAAQRVRAFLDKERRLTGNK